MPGPLGRAGLAGATAIALVAAGLFLPRRLAFGAVVVLAAVIAGAAVWLFDRHLWLPISVPLLLGLSVAGLAALERRLQFARGLTSALLPRMLSDQMLKDGAAAPHTQVASVMFLDLVGSTGLAERHGPDVYTRIMAKYYTIVTDAVDRGGGAVYKYEGDGVLALFFGNGDAEQDVRGALAAARRLAATLAGQMAAAALPDIVIRIGISTGPIAIGMLRFGQHASVSTMGDAVHRAYRLQEMGRELIGKITRSGVVVLIDEAPAALARKDGQTVLFRSTALLRGRSTPSNVYLLPLGDETWPDDAGSPEE